MTYILVPNTDFLYLPFRIPSRWGYQASVNFIFFYKKKCDVKLVTSDDPSHLRLSTGGAIPDTYIDQCATHSHFKTRTDLVCGICGKCDSLKPWIRLCIFYLSKQRLPTSGKWIGHASPLCLIQWIGHATCLCLNMDQSLIDLYSIYAVGHVVICRI